MAAIERLDKKGIRACLIDITYSMGTPLRDAIAEIAARPPRR